MSTTRHHLKGRHRILPETFKVKLYRRLPDSVYDTPILVGSAVRRPISRSEERLYDSVSGTVDRCAWRLWTETFRVTTGETFDPWSVEIGQQWIIKESGGREWVTLSADSELRGTRWRCPCYLYIGDPVITS